MKDYANKEIYKRKGNGFIRCAIIMIVIGAMLAFSV